MLLLLYQPPTFLIFQPPLTCTTSQISTVMGSKQYSQAPENCAQCAQDITEVDQVTSIHSKVHPGTLPRECFSKGFKTKQKFGKASKNESVHSVTSNANIIISRQNSLDRECICHAMSSRSRSRQNNKWILWHSYITVVDSGTCSLSGTLKLAL